MLKHLAHCFYEETILKTLLVVLAILGMVIGTGAAVAKEQVITLAVENMTCSMCPVTVRKALKAVEGVQEAEVSFETRSAVVTYDDEKVDPQTLLAATTNAGFPSTLMQEDKSDGD